MEHTKHFFLSITQRIFSNWTALRLAVEHDMGSLQNARDLCNTVTEVMYSSDKPRNFDLADYLDEYLYEKFSTELEDESQYEVAEELQKFFQCFENGEMIKAEQDFDKLPLPQSWIYKDQHIDINNFMPVENKSSIAIEEQDMEDQDDVELDTDKTEESDMDADNDAVDTSLDKNKDTDGWTLVTSKRNK